MATALVLPLSALLAACGSGNGQLKVSVSDRDKPCQNTRFACYKPGDTPTFTVSVVNAGPGSVTGVTIHATLPSAFRYRSSSITATGATRTEPLDAAVNSSTPIWGLWTIGPPGSAGGTTTSQVDIDVTVDVEGSPGDVDLNAFAAGDATSGQSNAAPLTVTVDPAPKLGVALSVSPSSLRALDMATYTARVTNLGTGVASNVDVLVVLPPVLSFSSTVPPFAGNSTRTKGTDPAKGAVEVYYDGFTLPPTSNAGPGVLIITFKAQAVANANPGSYPADAQVVDQKTGDVVTANSVATITVR